MTALPDGARHRAPTESGAGAAATQPTKRVRMAASERRAHLLHEARAVFAAKGYSQAGLAEVADRAGVSKTLLYHYYPDGRPQLYREVMAGLLGDLLGRMRVALRTPVSPERRLEGLIDAFLGFFGDEPDAYRLLILEPWGSGDAAIVGQAMGIRVQLGAELTQMLAGSGASMPTIQTAAAAVVGSLLHVTELWMSGQITRDDAVGVAVRFTRGGLVDLDLL